LTDASHALALSPDAIYFGQHERVAFLMGLHARAGSDSVLRKTLVGTPLYSPTVLRLVRSFCVVICSADV
jgi:hypothetical protein